MGGTRPRYARHSGAVFSLKYHVVWCPKYRREVLVPPVDTRLKKIIGTVAAEYGFTVHAIEVMPDHVVPKKASLLHRADCYRDVSLGGSPGRRAAITAVDFAKATVIPVEASDPNGPAAVLVESHIRTRRQRPKSDNECVHRFGIFAEQSLMRSRRALQCWKPVLKHSSDSAVQASRTDVERLPFDRPLALG